MRGRITPTYIPELNPSEIFVFGSNLSGIHGAGAAKAARRWGARYGVAIGISGNTYAIPTKDARIEYTIPLDEIQGYVLDFIRFAQNNTHLTFLVTPIGCGLAGLQPAQVAPLFKSAVSVSNIHLPKSFWREHISDADSGY
jgi:hypothetical protein